MEPAAVDGSTVRVKAHYAMHQTFFQKDGNRAPVEAALAEIIGQPTSLRISLVKLTTPEPVPQASRPAGPAGLSRHGQASLTAEKAGAALRPAADSELLKSVREVFGSELLEQRA